MDLNFAKPSARAVYTCKKCRLNPSTQVLRKCALDDFDALEGNPRKVDSAGLKYKFCPGKATWYPGLYELYEQCFVAMETGILPEEGSMQDQHCLFVDAFSAFMLRWKERNYNKIWGDVEDFVVPILKSLTGSKKT